ncbi:hypothetical protein WG66_007741 [Moniliophthora roreri]|nr:hypothetical protein WG66_007741 [Moniliophthora roreri]
MHKELEGLCIGLDQDMGEALPKAECRITFGFSKIRPKSVVHRTLSSARGSLSSSVAPCVTRASSMDVSSNRVPVSQIIGTSSQEVVLSPIAVLSWIALSITAATWVLERCLSRSTSESALGNPAAIRILKNASKK